MPKALISLSQAFDSLGRNLSSKIYYKFFHKSALNTDLLFNFFNGSSMFHLATYKFVMFPDKSNWMPYLHSYKNYYKNSSLLLFITRLYLYFTLLLIHKVAMFRRKRF